MVTFPRPKGNPRQPWILDSTPWITDSRYCISDSLSVKLGFQIRVVSGIPDSLSCMSDSKAQDSGFREQNFSDSAFQIPLHWAKLFLCKLKLYDKIVNEHLPGLIQIKNALLWHSPPELQGHHQSLQDHQKTPAGLWRQWGHQEQCLGVDRPRRYLYTPCLLRCWWNPLSPARRQCYPNVKRVHSSFPLCLHR